MGAGDSLRVGAPFAIAVPEGALDDLGQRLALTRLPAGDAGADWADGMPLAYARTVLDHWRHRFDWRAQERRFNGLAQRLIEIDGQAIHVLIEPGSGADPLPLLLLNGWPSSFVEFLGVIDRLAHPERHGGRIEDAFTVIIPAMPGYGFSPAPPSPMRPAAIAALWARMMAESFGIERYVVFGSDWGSVVAKAMASLPAAGLAAMLLTTSGGFPLPAPEGPAPAEAEQAWYARAGAGAADPEAAYQVIQAGKPRALAYAHADSPMGLAAWVIEKFRAWTTPAADGGPPFPLDDLLANVMIYWLNGPLAPMWLYAFLREAIILPGERVPVPAGFMLFGNDMAPPIPRSLLERIYDVRDYRVHPAGGHFPAQEVPDLFVAELTAFFRAFRGG